MAKKETLITAGNEPIPLSLDEFCIRLSTRDKRVELIAAFHFWLLHKNLTFGFEDFFQNQFDIFTGVQPAQE